MAQTNYKELVSLDVMGINAKNTGAILIGTTENGTQKFHPMYAVMVCSGGTLITIVPSLSIGTNASSYNNIVSAISLVNMTAAGNMTQPSLSASLGNIAANTNVYANITIGATATTCLVDIHLFGFYN